MSTHRMQGQARVVDTPHEVLGKLGANRVTEEQALTGWVMGKLGPWEEHRNRGYSRRWKEYWRLWRGIWTSDDRNRASERSHLIAPALSQAIEASVAEIQEILLSKSGWIDLADDVSAEDATQLAKTRQQLLEDLDLVKAKDVVGEACLNAAIFGTGIIKLNVVVSTMDEPVRDPSGRLEAKSTEKVYCVPESIRPDMFIPDPSGRTVEEMLGCGVRTVKSLHWVLEQIEAGVFRKEALGELSAYSNPKSDLVDWETDNSANTDTGTTEPVEVVEYQGKVPANLLLAIVDKDRDEDATALDDVLEALSAADEDEGPLVEAIIVIANGSVLLSAKANPFTMQDRGIITTPWEPVPGRFWGRGVAEKGWNPQKGLDAELRSRQDSLGYISAPMLAVDAGRMQKGFRMEVKPGRVWLCNGPPNEILQPIKMGVLEGTTFTQTQEMERMVQMGTGAFDTASTLSAQSQSGGASAGSNSLMLGAFVKRAKRAAFTIESNLVSPLIRKSLWRYMQFAPELYPEDFKFKVVGNMGIVAREVESMQMTQLLGMMPEEMSKTVSLAVTKGIVDMSSVTNKAEIMEAITQAMQPPSPEQQAKQKEMEELQFEAAKAQATQFMLENQKTMAEIRKLLNEAMVAARKADNEDERMQQEQARIMIQLEELNQMEVSNKLDARRLEIEDRRVDVQEMQVKQKATQGK